MARDTHGDRRRREILSVAADLSTTEGLEGLSFRHIAERVGVTRAAVAAHFDSKQALQLAVVAAAANAYAAPLAEAEARSEPGLPRLRALVRAWLGHLESIPYRGGCFFDSAGSDFAGRPGPVRDAIAAHTRSLLRRLEEQARLALRLGELTEGTRPDVLVFQLHALAQEANLRRELLGEAKAFELARRSVDALLEPVTASPPASDRTSGEDREPIPMDDPPRPNPRPKESS